MILNLTNKLNYIYTHFRTLNKSNQIASQGYRNNGAESMQRRIMLRNNIVTALVKSYWKFQHGKEKKKRKKKTTEKSKTSTMQEQKGISSSDYYYALKGVKWSPLKLLKFKINYGENVFSNRNGSYELIDHRLTVAKDHGAFPCEQTHHLAILSVNPRESTQICRTQLIRVGHTVAVFLCFLVPIVFCAVNTWRRIVETPFRSDNCEST